MLSIRNHVTGEISKLSRDVRDTHPDWVHEQLGTESESELQRFLDQCSLIEFAEVAPTPDEAGVYMDCEDAISILDPE